MLHDIAAAILTFSFVIRNNYSIIRDLGGQANGYFLLKLTDTPT